MARYSMLLENPRRRSRKRRSRRRKNPLPLARRRRSGGRSRRRGGRRRSNPFRLPGLGGGGIQGTLGRGVELYLGRLTGRLAVGVLNKVDAFANLPAPARGVTVGLLLPMLPARGMVKRLLQTAGSISIAAAIAGVAAGFENSLFSAINVNPGELADYVTDAGMGEYGLLGSDEYGAEQYLNDYVTDMG